MASATIAMPVAINRSFQGKLDGSTPACTWGRFNNTFENYSLDAEDLIGAVAGRRHPFSAPHEHIRRNIGVDDAGEIVYSSFRNSLNWLPTNMLALDVDDGILSMTDYIDMYGQDKVSAAYETSSSTDESPRYRIIMRCSDVVHKPENYRNALEAYRYAWAGVDATSIDIVKAYGGGKQDGRVYVNPKAVLSRDEVIEAIKEMEKHKAQQAAERAAAMKGKMATRSSGDGSFPTWTADDVNDMLSHIRPQQSYPVWRSIVFSVYSLFPNEIGIGLIESWSECKPNEVATIFRSLNHTTVRIGPGYIVTVAKNNGWKRKGKTEAERYIEEVLCRR